MHDPRPSRSIGQVLALLSVGAAFAVAPLLASMEQSVLPLLFIGVLLGTWAGGGWGGATAIVAGVAGQVAAGWLERGPEALQPEALLWPGLFATVSSLAVFGMLALRRRSAWIREERQHLHGTFHSIADALLVTDATGRVQHMNRIAEDLTGWAASAARGEPVDRVLYLTNPNTWYPTRAAQAMLRGEGRMPYEFRALGLLGRDGQHHVIEGSASRIQDARGVATGIVVVFRDVTQRRRSEAVLHASEERHRILTDLSFDFATTSVVAPDGEIVLRSATARFEAVTGYTPQALQSRGGWQSIIHPHDQPIAAAAVRRLLAGHPDTRDVRILTRTGDLRWLRFLAQPVRDPGDGHVRKIYGAVKDITEQKEEERARNEEIRQATFARDVGLALTRSDDAPEMLANCAEAMLRHLGGALARIWVFDAELEVLTLEGAAGESPDHDPFPSRIVVGGGGIGRIARDGQPFLTNDLASGLGPTVAAWAEREGMTAFAGYPMVVDDRLIGVMGVFARDLLTPSSLDAMAAVAGGIAVGIQRKRVEARRREEQEWLRVTLASIGDAVIATNERGEIVFLNRAAEALLERTEADAQGAPLDEVLRIHDEHTGEEMESPVRRVLREGRPVEHEGQAVLRMRDGTVRAVDVQAAPIRAAHGVLFGVVVVAQDVTEHRAGARALQTSEARKAAILETALDGIITIDHRGRIVEFNAAAERIFGFRGDEVIGTPLVSRLIPDRFRQAHQDGFARLLATGHGPMLGRRVELEALRADGTEFPLELAVAAIRTGQVPMFTAHVRDITDRRALERRRSARLAITEALALAPRVGDVLPLILQSACEGLGWDVGVVWMLEPDTGLLRCAEVWHSGRVDVDAFLRDTRSEHFRRGEGLPGRAWDAGHYVWLPDLAADATFSRKDAALRDGLHSGVAFPMRPGTRMLGVLEFYNREIRRPDPDVVELMTTLGGQIGQFIERQRAEQQLRDADRRKDQFLATLAHELRAPLAPIRNAIEIMRLERDDPTRTEPARQLVERQLRQLVRLVDDLLDLSRISRGRMDLRAETVPLADVVASAVETAGPHLEQGGQELALDLPEEEVLLHGDPTRLAQVVANLLNNAAKYTPRGGHVVLRAGREDEDVVIEVSDDGDGIPPELLDHVFEMFAQVRDGQASRGGLGIGLTLVRSLVTMHGGTVEAHSEGPGRGTTFRVRMPILAPPALARTQAPPADEPATEGTPTRRVLVVDDNVDAAESLGALLRLSGHEVHVAHDGPGALVAARDTEPEVVFLDVGMPDMDGCEVARRLRRLPGGAGVTLIALTGWGQESDRRRARAAGFDVHLTKPADPEEVRRLLATPARLVAR